MNIYKDDQGFDITKDIEVPNSLITVNKIS